MSVLSRFTSDRLNDHLLSRIAAGLAVATVALSAAGAFAASSDYTPNASFIERSAERVESQIATIHKIGLAVRHVSEMNNPAVSGDVKSEHMLAELNILLNEGPHSEISEYDLENVDLPGNGFPVSQTLRDAVTDLNTEKGFMMQATYLLENVAASYRIGDPKGIEVSLLHFDDAFVANRDTVYMVAAVLERKIDRLKAEEAHAVPSSPSAPN